MIPLYDSIPSRNRPWATLLLILVNVLAFVYELVLTRDELLRFVYQYGMVPATLWTPEGLLRLESLPSVVTAMFLHGGWLHILGNMLFLWVFGDNVEDSMGSGRFLLFYLLVGTAANVAYAWTAPTSTVVTLGASGAVAGVLGAYLLTYPRARVVTLVTLGFFVTMVEVPAVFFLLYWFLLQLINGVATLGFTSMGAGGVAWWAHVGGFMAGAILIPFFRRRVRAFV